MTRAPIRLAGVVLLALLPLAAFSVRQRAELPADAARIVAIGDVHGAYPQFVSLLKTLRLLDDQGRWSGGRTTLVQTGDFTDRGAHVRPLMDLLMSLEEQAQRAGGRVVGLLGNHEVMNVLHIVDDVAPAAYASFADDRSEARRTEAYEAYAALIRDRRRVLGHDPPGVLDEQAWRRAHPPGAIEYLEAFGPDGRYGRWLRRKQAVAALDGTIFLHGGLNPDVAARSVDRINDQVREEIQRFDRAWSRLVQRDVILPFFTFQEGQAAAKAELDLWVTQARAAPESVQPGSGRDQDYAETIFGLLQAGNWSLLKGDGPLWFRGFATWTNEEGGPRVTDVLMRYRATRVVVGHTVTATHRITPRFDGRVFLIDTGMLTEVYKGGRPSALEIVGDRATAVYLDETTPLSSSGP